MHELTLSSDTVGVYDGQCAEYCGLSHSQMRARVRVMSQEDFDGWLGQETERFIADRGVEDVSAGPGEGPPGSMARRI